MNKQFDFDKWMLINENSDGMFYAFDVRDLASSYEARIAELRAEIERLKALLPNRCDGKEQEAFEAWAKAHSMDLTRHPIHYLFLNARTGSARDGWGAALEYVSRTMQPSPPSSTQDGHDNKEGV